MEVRELTFSELHRLKIQKWWAEKNNYTKIVHDVRSGFNRIFGVTDDGKIIATIKVSEKVTALGRTLISNAVQVFGISISDEISNREEVFEILVKGTFADIKRDGYRHVIVVYSDVNIETKELCKRFNITDRIGSLYMENDKGDYNNYLIVKVDL